MTGSPRYLPQEWVIPEVDELNAPFFTEAAVRLQECTKCGTVQHPPLDLCHNCQSFDFQFVTAGNEGTVECFTIVHHAPHPMLKSVVPYNVAIVSLDSHPHVRIVGNVIDIAPADLSPGQPVVATWAAVPGPPPFEELQLLQWRCADRAQS